MYEKELREFGLTKNEAKIYEALLRKGISSATEISKKSKVDRTLIYGVIERLQHKGLISSVTKSNKKYFEPAKPKKILDLIEEKRRKIKNTLPELEKIFLSQEKKQEVHSYKGKEGAKTILEILLKEKKEWLIFGATAKAKEKISYYFPQFHRKREENKTLFKAIYSEESAKRAKEIKKRKYTQIRILPKEYMTPTHINIVGEKVGIILWDEEPLGILIESKKIAESFRIYFKLLWNIAKKI